MARGVPGSASRRHSCAAGRLRARSPRSRPHHYFHRQESIVRTTLWLCVGRWLAGVGSLMAVVLNATPATPGTSADPTQLPPATITQVPLTSLYNALGVPAKIAGEWYLDPTTAVKIHKLTSATFPASAANWGHDYAEGGDEISLPYTADGI